MYPYTYDELQTLDLNQCSIYSHTLTDGFLGDFYTFNLGTLQKFFVKYGTSTSPKLDLIKYDETYILKEIPGVKFNATSTYIFDVFIDDMTKNIRDVAENLGSPEKEFLIPSLGYNQEDVLNLGLDETLNDKGVFLLHETAELQKLAEIVSKLETE